MMIGQTIKSRTFLPFAIFIILVGIVLAYYLPSKQRNLFIQNQEKTLDLLVKAITLNINISLNDGNYSGLINTLEYVKTIDGFKIAAIVEKDSVGEEIFTYVPLDVPKTEIFNLSTNPAYITKSQELENSNLNGYFIVSLDKSGIDNEIYQTNKPVYLLIVLVSITVIFLYLIFLNRLTKPLMLGVSITQRLSDGNFNNDIPLSVKGEVGDFLSSLNDLQKNLNLARIKDEQHKKELKSEIDKQTNHLHAAIEEISEVRNLLGLIIDTALDAVVTINDKGEVTNWNHAAENIFGWAREEALSRKLDELIIPEEMTQMHKEGMKKYFDSGIHNVLNKQIEIQAKTKSGRIIDVELFITPIENNGVKQFSSFIRDITLSKSIQKQISDQRTLFKSIMDFLPFQIYLLDRDEKIVFVNKLLLDNAGVFLEDVIDKSVKEVAKTEALLPKIHSEVLNREINDVFEVSIVQNEIKSFFQIGSMEIENLQGDLLLVYAVDITESKKQEIELFQALNEKDRFVSTMSHEIRNPLNIIIGNSDLLFRKSFNNENLSLINTINQSSKHLLNLLNDILDFSKISSGSLELNNDLVDLKSISNELLYQFESIAKNKGITFSVITECKCDHKVFLDELRLVQVLSNLIGNAIKFTIEGGVVFKIQELEKDGSQGLVKFIIEDTGIGIDPKNIELIQNPFAQENSTITRHFGGTGLGLSIVNKILSLLGSKLEIDSKQNVGSTFSFQLKVQISDSPSSNENFADGEKSSINLNLLYIDDMLPNLLMVDAMVKEWDCTLDIVTSVDEALELCKKTVYDLILMDIQMPEKDGVTGLKEIKKYAPLNVNTPIAALTGNAEPKEIDSYLNVGFSTVITKPINSEKLYSSLIETINKNEHSGSI